MDDPQSASVRTGQGEIAIKPGDLISHYRILDALGEGGMGVVYRAVDVRLNRTVALKVIRQDPDAADSRHRFVKEARAASAFNHPNIVTIHEVDAAGDTDFIVMELVPGRSLADRVGEAGMPIDDAIAIGEQIAAAMSAAHDLGIVHRDIKPANVMVTDTGHVKVLDFGVAKQLAVSSPEAVTQTAADATRQGAVLGSVAYMSPEQTQGQAIDGRSDVFSLGVLLYEMLCGRRPFIGATGVETVAKILVSDPAPVAQVRPDVPPRLAALVSSCLTKDRTGRPTSIDVARQLADLRQSRSRQPARIRDVWTRRAVLVPVVLIVLAAAAFAAWKWYSGRDVREARRRLPAILALANRPDDFHAFLKEARSVVALLPDEPKLQQLWSDSTMPLPITSEPAGAEVRVKGYSAAEDDWILAGTTPIEARLPIGTPRIRISKEGYAPFDGTITGVPMKVTLDRVGSVPDGMIHLPAAAIAIEGVRAEIPDFWLDRFEVSNRQFKAFVDAGGYTSHEFWKEPFVESGRTLSWEDATGLFRDKTGRPGPSTWELGNFPQGQADFPVAGVSWYEAAAFAAYAGKSLPTAFQWRRAGDFAGPSAVFGHILIHGNFSGKGPSAIGSHRGISPWGSYDMAGNVKEWCWNESRGGRMILGGGWNEPTYMYGDRDAQSPLKRLDTYGFRLVRNVAPQPAVSTAIVPAYARDYAVEKPIDDSAFAIVKNVFQYDPRPLNAKLERTEDEEEWRRETVTFDAAYGRERVIAYLYLPKNTSPPYQTVIYFPGGDATLIRSSRQLGLLGTDFVIRGGRALVFPVYQGTYERGPFVGPPGPNLWRDVTVARVKDFRRVMEYIATRTDLDHDRIGYFGRSLGATVGTIITAVEPRLKTSVLFGGGLSRFATAQEVDPLNFAPRIHVPTLMVNGAGDFQYPLESTQKPLFRLIGVPPDQKRHALFEGGHLPLDFNGTMREILDWYDRFLGPVGAPRKSGS